MKHCKICKVDVQTDKHYCPLCFNEMTGNSKDKSLFLTNTSKETTNKKNYLATQILLFISLSVSIICGFINFLTYNGVLWSLVVGAGILYLWILIKHTIMSNRNAFERVFFQLFGIILIMVCTNIVSGKGDWLLNYVLPSLSIVTAIVLGFIMLCAKRRKNFLVSFLIIYVLLFIFSIVLLACKFDTFKLLNQINLMVTGLAILGEILLGYKTIKNELSKKLHL